MPVPCSTSVSFAMLGTPVDARFAPFALTELAQPLPALPALPHGHAVPLPSPKQNAAGPPPTVNWNQWIAYVSVLSTGTGEVMTPSLIAKLMSKGTAGNSGPHA